MTRIFDMSQPVIVWIRNDLRLEDHPALHAAASENRAVIPVYLWTPEAEGEWPRGGASRWWLNHALEDFDQSLRGIGSRLVLRRGPDPEKLLGELLEETGAAQIYWNRRYDPVGVKTDTALKKRFPAKSFRGNVLFEPHQVQTQSGDFYKVFTPFYRNVQGVGDPPDPLEAPKHLQAPDRWPESDSLENWKLLPEIPWDVDFYTHWKPTAAGASAQAHDFLDEAAGVYKEERDFPAKSGTSRLSPFLHFGQLSSRLLWHQALEATERGTSANGMEAWTRQLVWRDFATHLLFHQPQLDLEPMQEKFRAFPWEKNAEKLKAWQEGRTGYPIVDAGMRELWHTGWMHNRVRMIVASFLVKDLLLPWQDGARWFWDTLVDADLANNSFGWQWAAGCGADAAPYFRIFNPELQSKKFDAEGTYIKKWVPELNHLDPREVHAPPASRLPKGYPPPIVDHKLARDKALEALHTISVS